MGLWQRALDRYDPPWRFRLPNLGRGETAYRRCQQVVRALCADQRRDVPRWDASPARWWAEYYERQAEQIVREHWTHHVAECEAEEERERREMWRAVPGAVSRRPEWTEPAAEQPRPKQPMLW